MLSDAKCCLYKIPHSKRHGHKHFKLIVRFVDLPFGNKCKKHFNFLNY